MADKTLREALNDELARQGKPTMAERIAAEIDPTPAKPAHYQPGTNAYQRKLIRGMAGHAAVETMALYDEFVAIQAGTDPATLHSHRMAAWANVERVKDALHNLANEIDRMGE